MGAVLCALALFLTFSVIALSLTASFVNDSVSDIDKTACKIAVTSAADMICDILTSEIEPLENDIRTYLKSEIGDGVFRENGGKWQRYISPEETPDAVRTFSMSLSEDSPVLHFDMYWECPAFSEEEIPRIILTVSVYASRKNESFDKTLRFMRLTDGVDAEDHCDPDAKWRWCLYE